MIAELPPEPRPPAIEWRQPDRQQEEVSRPLQQEPPPAEQPARVDIGVEVFGDPALEEKVDELSRRLSRRQATRSLYRVHLPPMLELIRLVQRNPEKPRRSWSSITVLNIGYDTDAGLVTVTYCVEYCGFSPRAGAMGRRQRLVSYSAPMDRVMARVDARLQDLAKYADR